MKRERQTFKVSFFPFFFFILHRGARSCSSKVVEPGARKVVEPGAPSCSSKVVEPGARSCAAAPSSWSSEQRSSKLVELRARSSAAPSSTSWEL
jgi:hypothetical protein